MAVRRIVLVTEDGALSTEQLFLLYLTRWLARRTAIGVEVLTWRAGPLTEDLRAEAPVVVLDDLNHWRPARVFEVLRLRRPAQVLKGMRLRWWLWRRRHVDCWYVNGLPTARLLGFARAGPPVVVHVHDAAEVDDPRLGPEDRALVVERARRWVAAGDAAADALRDRLGVRAERIERHDVFVAGADQLPPSAHPPTRAELGLGDDDLVIGATGSADWWAAADQFVLWAWRLRARRPELPVRFVWITGEDDPRILWPLRHDLDNAGLTARTVVASTTRPLDVLRVLDLLVLSTRVQAQELIALEAAASGVPVIATDNLSLGAAPREIALVVPYLDVDALVDAIEALVDDPDRRSAQVERAADVARRHHDVDVGAGKLLAMVEGLR